MSFASLGLSDPLLRAVQDYGYNEPSPIQTLAIPAILSGRDVLAAAQTGTGKTAGFALPIIENLAKGLPAKSNQARALILTPTRELAVQVHDNIQTYAANLSVRSAVVYGGVKINPQMLKLRQGADILVATPGRLLDLYQRNAVRFDKLEVLVLDEADRMLDMGFINDIKKIIASLPPRRQTLLFSATFSQQIRELSKSIVKNPTEISVSPPNSTAKKVKQWIIPVDKKQKPALLSHLVRENQWDQVLAFSKTKHGANKIATFLEKQGITALAIHGNKSQGARTRALEAIKTGEIRVLVATDIAARGLDIELLPHVINIDLPKVAEDYVHRIGRTGRAGAAGEAISLVSADEFDELTNIERLIQKPLPRQEVEGFEPSHQVPESKTNLKPLKPKKPKKPRKPQNPEQVNQSRGSVKANSTGTERVNAKKKASRRRRPARNNAGANNKPAATVYRP
ncbi:MAG: DEAD/DEAH box helicase [Ketobacteraceae bacterium]|nr:DEAD/DEAH box helicase [Ketobacteraceae bacterium]